MTWEQIVLIVMLVAPIWVVVQVVSADGVHRIDNDELIALGVVVLWNAAIALVLYLGGFWC